MMVRIPEEKLQKLRNLLQPLLYKKKVSLKDLESLTGLMAYCSRAIPSSRAFIRRFYDLIAAVNNKKPHYMVRINQEVKADVQMWLQFLIEFNGQCYIPEKKHGYPMTPLRCLPIVPVTLNWAVGHIFAVAGHSSAGLQVGKICRFLEICRF